MSFIFILIEFQILDVESLMNLFTLHGLLIQKTVLSSSLLIVSRSQNMKQKIYEVLTSPKRQKNGVILNNCID